MLYQTQGSQWYNERKEFPIVSTAVEFSKYLNDVQERGSGWDYQADAPCHQSTSKSSFVFKDAHPSGLDIHCFAGCVDTGSSYVTFVDNVEMALGVRINLRYHNGNLRWERKWKTYRERLMESSQHDRVLTYKSRNVRITETDDDYTLADLMMERVWIPTTITSTGARIPFEFQHRNKRYGFVQSNKDMQLAQDGGGVLERTNRRTQVTRSVNIIGWQPSAHATLRGKELGANSVGLVLSGDENVPARTDVGVVDFDLKEIDDNTDETTAKHLEWRNSVYAALSKLGCPIIKSRSGLGFHALWRQLPDEYTLWDDRNAVANLVPEKQIGAGIDFYPAGSRRLINIVMENITEEMKVMQIPRIPFAEFHDILRSNEELHQQRMFEQPKSKIEVPHCWIHNSEVPCEPCEAAKIVEGECQLCYRTTRITPKKQCVDLEACKEFVVGEVMKGVSPPEAVEDDGMREYLVMCKRMGVMDEARQAYHQGGS